MPWVWIEVWHTPELWCGEKWCPWLTSPSFPPVVWTDLPGLCRFWPTTSESHGFKANTWEQNLHSTKCTASLNYYSKMKWQGGMAIEISVQSHAHLHETIVTDYWMKQLTYISRSKWNLKDQIFLILFWSSLVPMQNKKEKCLHSLSSPILALKQRSTYLRIALCLTKASFVLWVSWASSRSSARNSSCTRSPSSCRDWSANR